MSALRVSSALLVYVLAFSLSGIPSLALAQSDGDYIDTKKIPVQKELAPVQLMQDTYSRGTVLERRLRDLLLTTTLAGSYSQKKSIQEKKKILSPGLAFERLNVEILQYRGLIEAQIRTLLSDSSFDSGTNRGLVIKSIQDYFVYVTHISSIMASHRLHPNPVEWVRSIAIRVPNEFFEKFLAKSTFQGYSIYTLLSSNQDRTIAYFAQEKDANAFKGNSEGIFSSSDSNEAVKMIFFSKNERLRIYSLFPNLADIQKITQLSSALKADSSKIIDLFKGEFLQSLRMEQVANRLAYATLTAKIPEGPSLKALLQEISKNQTLNLQAIQSQVKDLKYENCAKVISNSLRGSMTRLLEKRYADPRVSKIYADIAKAYAMSADEVKGAFQKIKDSLLGDNLLGKDVVYEHLVKSPHGLDQLNHDVMREIFQKPLLSDLKVNSDAYVNQLFEQSAQIRAAKVTADRGQQLKKGLDQLIPHMLVVKSHTPKLVGDWGCSLGQSGQEKSTIESALVKSADSLSKVFSSSDKPEEEIVDLRIIAEILSKAFLSHDSGPFIRDHIIRIKTRSESGEEIDITDQIPSEKHYPQARMRYGVALAQAQSVLLNAKEKNQSVIVTSEFEKRVKDVITFGSIVGFSHENFINNPPKLSQLNLTGLNLPEGVEGFYKLYTLKKLARVASQESMDTRLLMPIYSTSFGMHFESLRLGDPVMLFEAIQENPKDALNLYAQALMTQVQHVDKVIHSIGDAEGLEGLKTFLSSSSSAKELLSKYTVIASPALHRLKRAMEETLLKTANESKDIGYLEAGLMNLTGIQDQVLMGAYMGTMVVDTMIPGVTPALQRLKSISYSFNRGMDGYFVLTLPLMAGEFFLISGKRIFSGHDQLIDFSTRLAQRENHKRERDAYADLDGDLEGISSVMNSNHEALTALTPVFFIGGAMLLPVLSKLVKNQLGTNSTRIYTKAVEDLLIKNKSKFNGALLTESEIKLAREDAYAFSREILNKFNRGSKYTEISSEVAAIRKAMAIQEKQLSQMAKLLGKELQTLGLSVESKNLNYQTLKEALLKDPANITPEKLLAFTKIEREIQERVIRAITGDPRYLYGDSNMNKKPFGTARLHGEFHFSLSSLVVGKNQVVIDPVLYSFYKKKFNWLHGVSPKQQEKIAEAMDFFGLKAGALEIRQLNAAVKKAHQKAEATVSAVDQKKLIEQLDENEKLLRSYLNSESRI